MPLLLELPTEILIQIFAFVGSSNFRVDPSRLTVSKQWSVFAFTICFQDFYANQETLQRLRRSGLPPPQVLKDNVETLDLNLEGFNLWQLIPLTRAEDLHPADAHHVYDMNMSRWNGHLGQRLRVDWTTEFNDDLHYLAAIVTQSRKPRTLRIKAANELHPTLPLDRREYIFLSSIRAFLSATNLTSLELDLCGSELLKAHSSHQHICPRIAELLPRLRRLRLRMRTICADVLKLQEHRTDNLRLEEVLINLALSLTNESPLITQLHAEYCGSCPWFNLPKLNDSMERQAQILVAHMAAPKRVRILTRALGRYSHVQIRAYDVWSGRDVMLSRGAEWDDDGEVTDPELSDEESEILSSDDDE